MVVSLIAFLPLVAAIIIAVVMYTNMNSRSRFRDSQGKLLGFLVVTIVLAFVLIVSGYQGILSWPMRSASLKPEDSAISGSFTDSGNLAPEQKFYGIMFDAGSTGSRIHVFEFVDQGPGKPPKYLREVFQQIHPGLSSFAEDPTKGAESLLPLLKEAIDVIPEKQHSQTWVALKATAGLRALPQSQSDALLHEVNILFDRYAFRKAGDSVTIMEGVDEGKFSWFSVNFLAGVLGDTDKMVGVMDLGGGSTQVTFVPTSKATLDSAPTEYLRNTDIFGKEHKLYTHSYPLGLMAGRYKILEAQGAGSGNSFSSVCFPPDKEDKLKFNNNEYTIKGSNPSSSRYDECLQLAKKVVSEQKIHKIEEANTRPFWIISYYYDRAVDAKLIDAADGGSINIGDYVESAKKECASPNSEMPWHCMDLCFISSLLQEGFGFKPTTEVTLRKQINNNEISWCLGAMFDWFGSHKDQSPIAAGAR